VYDVIYQLVLSLSYGDAIGNDILAIDRALKQKGYSTQILASIIDDRVKQHAVYFQPQRIAASDVVIYHKACGEPLTEQFNQLPCKKIMLYHNITPAEFFRPYDKLQAWRLKQGRKQVADMVPYLDYAWADSTYNLQEIIAAGMAPNKTAVLPIIVEFERYKKTASKKLMDKLKERQGTKLLFIGRIAPNKCQEDIIKVFFYYKNLIDSKAQLYLVGSYRGTEKYYAKLKGFVASLKLKDVYFTGHIPFEELLSYYHSCDIFVCMSEHEGFCVPLLESMYFDLPVVAYDSSAISETLAGGGVLLQKKDFGQFCEAITRLQKDSDYRESILIEQRKALERYQPEVVTEKLYQLIETVMIDEV